MISKNAGHLMERAKKGRITEIDRKTVIRHLAYYLVGNFDPIQQQHKIAAAKCFVYHFPCFKEVDDEQNGGIVSIFLIIHMF